MVASTDFVHGEPGVEPLRSPLLPLTSPLCGLPAVEAVGGADFGRDGDGEGVAFASYGHALAVDLDVVDGDHQRAGGGAGDDDLVAHMQFAGFHNELAHA